MKTLMLIAAAVTSLSVMPAVAGELGSAAPASGTPVAQLDFCVGTNCRDSGYDRHFDRRYDYGRAYDRDRRLRERGCRDVTIRDRRPDGDVVIRHERRCGSPTGAGAIDS
jgi:hypothetical protein